MPLVEGDFPFLQLSPSMMRVLWSKQMAQIRALTAQGVGSRGRDSSSNAAGGVCDRVSEMERRQRALLGLINKEVQHTKRMVRTLQAVTVHTLKMTDCLWPTSRVVYYLLRIL